MILYLSPGACSLADHIALHEAGFAFSHVRVDLKAKTTEAGEAYLDINPKGYVPALKLDTGEILTENIAILSWISEHAPAQIFTPPGSLGRTRLLETLAYISTELHKGFKPFFTPGAADDAKDAAAAQIGKRLTYLADRMAGDYLFGDRVSAADCYLFVMLTWARKNHVPIPSSLSGFFTRMAARPCVIKALAHEGLSGSQSQAA